MRVAVFIAMMISSLAALANPPIETGTFNNKAIYGYDPIGYWNQGKAVKGSDEHVLT